MQLVRQPPQCAALEVRSKQPVPQQVWPIPQVVPHVAQFAKSFGTQPPLQHSEPPVHTVQEPPQWVVSLATQLPAQHTWPTAQARPHIPQLNSSVSWSTQEASQQDVPPVHAGEQPAHTLGSRHIEPQHWLVAPEHVVVQLPQWVSSARVSKHVPPQHA